MKQENQLYMIALSLPNTKALALGGISASILICVVAVMWNYIKRNKRASIPMTAIILLFYCIQYLIRSNDVLMGIVMPIKTMVNILFFLLLTSNMKIAQKSFDTGLKASISMFVGITSALVASIFGNSELGGRFTIAGNDSNMISIEIAFVIAYLSVAYFTRKQISNIAYLGIACALGLMSMMCSSRMGILLYIFVIIVSLSLNARRVGKTMMMIVVLGVAGVSFLLLPFGQSLIDGLLLRMEVLENAADISNGRFEIWNEYFAVLNSNQLYWLFGLGSYADKGLENMAHNFLLEDIAAYGIIGVILLYSTYVSIYRKQYRLSHIVNPFRWSLYYSMPFFVPIIGSLTLHGLGSIMITTMLYLGVLCMTGAVRRNV